MKHEEIVRLYGYGLIAARAVKWDMFLLGELYSLWEPMLKDIAGNDPNLSIQEEAVSTLLDAANCTVSENDPIATALSDAFSDLLAKRTPTTDQAAVDALKKHSEDMEKLARMFDSQLQAI